MTVSTCHCRSWSSFNLVQLEQVSPSQPVPDDIPLPPYALTGIVPPSPLSIEIKTQDQIDCMKKSCQLAYQVLDSVKSHIKVRWLISLEKYYLYLVCISLSFLLSSCATYLYKWACNLIDAHAEARQMSIIALTRLVFVLQFYKIITWKQIHAASQGCLCIE